MELNTITLLSVALSLSSGITLYAASPVSETSKEVFTPHTILADGVDSAISTNPYTGEQGPARKGTVAATVNNVALLNKALTAEVPDDKHIEALIDAMKALIPSLRVIGMFDVLSVDAWLADDKQPGRILIAALYLQNYPKEMTPEIRQRLNTIKAQTKIKHIIQTIEGLLNQNKI